jgi:hypothetical protein
LTRFSIAYHKRISPLVVWHDDQRLGYAVIETRLDPFFVVVIRAAPHFRAGIEQHVPRLGIGEQLSPGPEDTAEGVRGGVNHHAIADTLGAAQFRDLR